MHTAQPTIDIYGCKGVLLPYEYPNAVVCQGKFLVAETLVRQRNIRRILEFSIRFAAQERLPRITEVLNVSIDAPVTNKKRRLKIHIGQKYLAGADLTLGNQMKDLVVSPSKAVGYRWELLQMTPERRLQER